MYQVSKEVKIRNNSHGQRARPQKGHYKAMNEGLITAIAPSVDNISDDEEFEEIVEHHDDLYNLPPDVAFAGHYATDPRMLDKALRGLNGRKDSTTKFISWKSSGPGWWKTYLKGKLQYHAAKSQESSKGQMATSKHTESG